MKKPHTTEESIEEEDLYGTAELIVEIIRTVAKVEKENY